MTNVQAVMQLLASGWTLAAPGEKPAAVELGVDNQCGSCLRWMRSRLVELTKYQRIYLCEDCNAGHPPKPDVMTEKAAEKRQVYKYVTPFELKGKWGRIREDGRNYLYLSRAVSASAAARLRVFAGDVPFAEKYATAAAHFGRLYLEGRW